ncbi:amino acid adenylation domain-containing protein, partial [Paenibacillus sepulcri]|nr:amino acid adenylation domain-containing protein [Paenibacillus sepulcri]
MHTPNIPADSRHNNDTDRLTEEEIYWLGKLSPDLSMSSFAVDHKMVRAEIQNTEIYTFKLSDEISRRITAVSKGSEYGVFIILLCGIQYLLSIHSGNKDVVVGIPVFRTKSGPAFQGNHLIIRNVMDSRMTFKDLLFEVKQTISDAGKHQKVSYSKLAKLLHLETPAGDLPKPRTVVLLENIQNNASAGQSAADTTFQFNLAGEHIHCRVSFKTGGITQETIRGIANHFNHFFRTVLDNPDILLSGIGIPDEERSRLLYEFNETAAPYPKDKTVVDWFEEQVERTPHQTAVVYQNRKLTYRELNAKANQIAYLLIGHGIGEGSVVGIMVERSLEMPVGMMGILKTGGAYLPIDPSLPKERIRSLLNNSQAGIILVNGNLEVNISDPEMKIVDIGSALASSVPEAMDNPGLTYDPEGMMYVLFTSGTTGVPKGVMVKRRSFVNLLNWYIRELKLSDADDLMLIAPLSFDTAHKNLFAPLLVGGRLHLFTAGMYDYNEMSDVIARERITVINCSPSALYPLIDYNENNEYRKLSPLKHVIVGGEPINLKKLKPWLQSPECRSDVINTYGPTECTDIAASFKFNRLNMEQLEIVPLGKPLPNTEIYIVDEDTNLQPIGVAGELCISGDGLSLGYYNAPNLTNEKFVECPFYPGKKIYKTGDLARWMQDGTLEFLGRKDFQTKIRGFRVELGEVEHCLLQHPGVEEAIAVSMKDSAGMDVLCAYFVSRQKLPVAELRSYVAQKLPDFMIPAYFTQLDKMPLNNNGKIDRKALPAPDPDTAASSPYAAPESNMERLFAGIWEEVLGVARVGIHDDFFELGGHSLKAAAIVLKINRELETSLQISGLFRHPNIRAFAKYAESLQGRQYPAIRPVETTGTYPVPSQQKRLFILWQLDRSSLAYNMTSVNMIEGGLDRRKLEDTLGRLIRRHESLRTSFIFKDGELVQTIRPDITFTLEFEEAEEIWLQRAVNDFVKPFDLEKEPLFRVKLMKVGDNRHLLLTDIHHIVFDGASMDILMQEFSELYSGMSQSELELQYKDYSVWQAEQNAADDRRRQEAYWLNLFKDGVPELQLNTDYPRQPVIRFEGGSVSVLANAELTASLRAVAAESGATLYMLLLSAVNALLFKYTGQEDVVIGSPTAGRSHPGLERIVGMFVNTVVMRNFPCGGKTFNALLGEVKENTLKAFENEQYPFEVLVDKLGVPRNTGRNPLYDVIFAQESDDRAAMDTAGLSFREYPVEERSAQIDLSIRALEKRSTLDFRFKYRTDLFAEETIARMAGHFIRLLEEIAQNRDVRLQDIRILSDQDERLLLEGFNNTQTEFPYEKTVHELIGRQVRDTPTETAIVYKDRQLTYAELDEQANRLARVLRNKGVKRNDIIGIIAEPSAEMVISVLGVLKSGGAYLPIDPGFPVNRIRYMLEDSRCSLIVTQRPLQEFLKLDQIALDDESLSQVEASCPENVNLPGDLAYVIYTSGTTGKPK